MPRWCPDDIPWSAFDRGRVDSDILQLIKAAALTEHNAGQYTRYLKNVFHDDAEFTTILDEWQLEEEQHGRVLGRYAELADPAYDFAAVFQAFRQGYIVPTELSLSVRGSRVGELVARCIVETGTSSFYSAMADATGEPVLKDISRRIAADEFRHYATFLGGIGKYQPAERLSRLDRLKVAIGRVRESEDDELAFAYHCGNEPGLAYDHDRCNSAYARRAYGLYRYDHAQRAVAMIFKAAGLNPQGWLARHAAGWAWRKMRQRAKRMAA